MTMEEFVILWIVLCTTITIFVLIFLSYWIGRLREQKVNSHAWDEHLNELDSMFLVKDHGKGMSKNKFISYFQNKPMQNNAEFGVGTEALNNVPLFIKTTPTPAMIKFTIAISQAMNDAMAQDEYYDFKPADLRKVIDEQIAERKW